MGLVSPSGTVETPRLQAKKGLVKSTKVDEPGFVEMRNHGELLRGGPVELKSVY